jgi:hypothetical protein
MRKESEKSLTPRPPPRSTFKRAYGTLSFATWGIVMFGKLILFAIAFSLILNYLIVPVLTALAQLIGRLGAEGVLKHVLVLTTFALLVFSLGVFAWLGARFLRLR